MYKVSECGRGGREHVSGVHCVHVNCVWVGRCLIYCMHSADVLIDFSESVSLTTQHLHGSHHTTRAAASAVTQTEQPSHTFWLHNRTGDQDSIDSLVHVQFMLITELQ